MKTVKSATTTKNHEKPGTKSIAKKTPIYNILRKHTKQEIKVHVRKKNPATM